MNFIWFILFLDILTGCRYRVFTGLGQNMANPLKKPTMVGVKWKLITSKPQKRDLYRWCRWKDGWTEMWIEVIFYPLLFFSYSSMLTLSYADSEYTLKSIGFFIKSFEYFKFQIREFYDPYPSGKRKKYSFGKRIFFWKKITQSRGTSKYFSYKKNRIIGPETW